MIATTQPAQGNPARAPPIQPDLDPTNRKRELDPTDNKHEPDSLSRGGSGAICWATTQWPRPQEASSQDFTIPRAGVCVYGAPGLNGPLPAAEKRLLTDAYMISRCTYQAICTFTEKITQQEQQLLSQHITHFQIASSRSTLLYAIHSIATLKASQTRQLNTKGHNAALQLQASVMTNGAIRTAQSTTTCPTSSSRSARQACTALHASDCGKCYQSRCASKSAQLPPAGPQGLGLNPGWLPPPSPWAMQEQAVPLAKQGGGAGNCMGEGKGRGRCRGGRCHFR